jgi:hypothetical protein
MKQSHKEAITDAIVVHRYFEFINLRYKIYLDKNAGLPRPWTTDVILNTYKFTNIFRELDRGTVWYREHIREPYANDPELFFNTCVYRHFNYFPTAERMGYINNYTPDLILALEGLFAKMKSMKIKIYTSAHMINGNIKNGGMKTNQSLNFIFRDLWKNREELQPTPDDTLESAYKRFKSLGFGPFTRYEVITDLRHTRYLRNATDIMTWANAGPGAMRGIDRICGVYCKKAVFSEQQYLLIMRELLSVSKRYLMAYVPDMEMRDIEHSLCEFDKYERGRLGQGHLRAKYVPYQV